jgi:hypothetical protein
MLDLTSAVRSGPELAIELRVRGGNVELVLAPGMVVDANELPVRHSKLAISRDAGDNTPETLHVRLVGRMKHGRIDTRWLAPRRRSDLVYRTLPSRKGARAWWAVLAR